MSDASENPFVSEVDLLNEGLRPFSYWQARATKVLNAWEQGSRAAGVSTGFEALDDFIRLTPGEVTILAARPGMGKTALALQIAGTVNPDPKTNERVAVFSAEMSGWSLYMRLACAAAQVSMFDLRARRATAVQFDRVRSAIRMLNNMPILVDDRSAPSTKYMREELTRMSKVYDITCLIFDFMELIGDEGAHGEQLISNAMKQLKSIAKDFDIPVIVISHLNREVEDRRTKIPQLSDFRYSGMIEQLADIALLMVRPRYYTEKGVAIDLDAFEKLEVEGGGGVSNLDDIAYIFVAKNRNGRSGIARLAYDGPSMRFFDVKRSPLVGG